MEQPFFISKINQPVKVKFHGKDITLRRLTVSEALSLPQVDKDSKTKILDMIVPVAKLVMPKKLTNCTDEQMAQALWENEGGLEAPIVNELAKMRVGGAVNFLKSQTDSKSPQERF